MMSPLLRALLIGLRANCEATICAIETYLAMTQPTDETKPTDEPPAAVPPPPQEDGPCQHPNLLHAPVMGNPGRFLCQNPKCQAEVNK